LAQLYFKILYPSCQYRHKLDLSQYTTKKLKDEAYIKPCSTLVELKKEIII